ncbi:hypothetical protein C8N36_11842 [Pelagimonas varians]|uniref:Uncharacterized protein n=1 Tax=Pelagimonas varians TaxID=696760 RepID=A0A238K2M1_9RHOB|nr:hypothetical protein C8N36_11842 [Pelagimonas varians]SMX37140.1 hypothetical protein PEV8663_00939 [Pelagimonas varians]
MSMQVLSQKPGGVTLICVKRGRLSAVLTGYLV